MDWIWAIGGTGFVFYSCGRLLVCSFSGVARVVFVLLVVLFAAVAPLKPFYIISGWSEFFMRLRLLAHGFMLCLLYFGSPREDFAPTSA